MAAVFAMGPCNLLLDASSNSASAWRHSRQERLGKGFGAIAGRWNRSKGVKLALQLRQSFSPMVLLLLLSCDMFFTMADVWLPPAP